MQLVARIPRIPLAASVAFPSGLQVRAWCDMQCRGAQCRLQVLNCVPHACRKACHAAEPALLPDPTAAAACCPLPPPLLLAMATCRLSPAARLAEPVDWRQTGTAAADATADSTMELNPAFSFDFGGEADAHQAPWEFGGERCGLLQLWRLVVLPIVCRH